MLHHKEAVSEREESSSGFMVFGYTRLLWLSPSFMPKLATGFSQLSPLKSDILDILSFSVNAVIESLALINNFTKALQSCGNAVLWDGK